MKEYYILDGTRQETTFYRLNKYGIYETIRPTTEDIIESQVLPGFQFRLADLYRRPMPKELVTDPVYRGFIMLNYQAEAKARQEAEAKAQAEANTRAAMEVELAQLREELARLRGE